MINSMKLKGRLRELGLTQKDLAYALKLSKATISQKLSGFRPLTIDEAEKIAEVLRIPDSAFGSYFFSRELRSADSGELESNLGDST